MVKVLKRVVARLLRTFAGFAPRDYTGTLMIKWKLSLNKV